MSPNEKTNALFVATHHSWDVVDDSTVSNKLNNWSDHSENTWLSDIDDNTGNYSIGTYTDENIWPTLNNPSGTFNARNQARDWFQNNAEPYLNYYDSIIVIDWRRYRDGYNGAAWIRAAGTQKGIGYVNGSGNNGTALHELLHLYGGEHADKKQEAQDGKSTFESTLTHHSIMGNFGEWSCNVNESWTAADRSWISECTKSAVHEYIDNSGNIPP